MQLHFIYVYAFIFPEPGWSCLAATLTNTHQPFTLPTFSPFAVILFQLFSLLFRIVRAIITFLRFV